MTGVNYVPGGISRRVPGTRSDISITITGDGALAKPRGGIAEDVVDGALDVTVGIVLLPALCVEGVLVAVKAAGIVSLLVSVCGYGYCLGALSVEVLEVDVVGFEVGTDDVESGRCVEAASCGRIDVACECHHIGLLGANTANIISMATLWDELYTANMCCTHFEV